MTNKLVYRPSGEIPAMAIAGPLCDFVLPQDEALGVNGSADFDDTLLPRTASKFAQMLIGREDFSDGKG